MSIRDEIMADVTPGDDFFKYVNQKWIDAHPIPDDKSRVGAFQVLTDSNIERLHELIEQPAKGDEALGIRLVKEYYRAAMDEAAITRGTEAVVGMVKTKVQALTDTASILAYVAERHAAGIGLLWEAIVDVDDKDSQRYLVRLSQDGLGLPDRDYYLEDNENFVKIREQYQAFLARLFELTGQDNGAERAGRVYALELALAQASMAAVDRRDPDKNYNPFTPAELEATFTGLDWTHYLSTLGLSKPEQVVVSQTDFLTAALKLVETESLEAWQDYLTVHSLLPLLGKLATPYEELNFDFYGKTLSGAKAQEERYKRIIKACMNVLPEPTGQLFVETYFDETSKAAIYDLVGHLQAAFKTRLAKLDWMSEATKAKAYGKLATFLPLLGYPDTWKSYDGLELGDNYADNYLAVMRFEMKRVVDRIDQPVDKREWLMSPVLVNAYYWPNTNGITFPAGILQPPFFDARGDFALNFGSIGAVIGHEITHGFDDQGSQFDAEGNLKSWWTEADRNAFEQRAERLVEQYNSYEIDGRHVNGKLTLGENIADLGGIQMAYDALQTKLEELGSREEVDGFTPEQRFFIGYAISWRESIRPELRLQFLVSDPHSPDELRTNGIVRNTDTFYEAFGVKPDEALYLPAEERVRIW